jgi:hypothetical protein
LKILVLILLLLIPGWADAARLGLHVTTPELLEWRRRMTDNVTTINGFTYQAIYTNRIKADADTFVAQSHPNGDGHWEGKTTAGCVPNDATWVPGAGSSGFNRGNGALMMRSAFTFLLTGDTSYATPVRSELLQQISEAGTDFTDLSRWCYTVLGGSNFLEIAPWLVRLVLSYDYLIAGGYSGFSEGEKTSIKAWFLAAADVFDDAHVDIIVNRSGFYPDLYDVPQALNCAACSPGTSQGAIYFGGPTTYNATYFTFYNQFVHGTVLSMAVGLMVSNQTLIDRAVAYTTAFIKAGFFDNGALSQDFRRWPDCDPECPRSMWAHTFAVLAGLTSTIDMYARAGNTSLYTLTAPTQIIGGSGGTVGLATSLGLLADMANNTVQLYGTTSAGELDEAHRLSWNTQGHSYWHFSSAVANLFYRDADITTSVTHATLGTNTNGIAGCTDNQYSGCFSGSYSGIWADIPFMFGNMHNNAANPYLASTGPTRRRLSGVTDLSGQLVQQ